MRHGKRNKAGWARFAGMPLRETQAGCRSSSQRHEAECDLRDGRAVLESGPQGDRSLRVWRRAGFAAQEMGAAGRNVPDAYRRTGEAGSEEVPPGDRPFMPPALEVPPGDRPFMPPALARTARRATRRGLRCRTCRPCEAQASRGTSRAAALSFRARTRFRLRQVR